MCIRDRKKKIEYVQDDLVNQRVDIASNRQEMGGIDDTVSTMNKQFNKVKQKLDMTANQSYLLSGNLSSIKKDLESIRIAQNNQQNQIDMMSGALANNIQEVIRVQGKFGDVERGVENNQVEIKKLSNNLELKTDELAISINSSNKDLRESINLILAKLDDMDNNAVIEGENGKIIVDNPWMPGRDGGPYHTKIRVITNDVDNVAVFTCPEHLFFFEAELACQCIAKEKIQPPHPAMTWEDTLGNLKALDTWRDMINYKLPQDDI